MIVLDTNVLSEPLCPRPDARVLGWLERNPDVGVTSVTVGELLSGARMLPHGRRREGLLDGIERMVESHSDRVFAYDEHAARTYATLQERRREAGSSLAVEDGMIAATCLSVGAVLATRNIKDFAGLGLELIDPWRD